MRRWVSLVVGVVLVLTGGLWTLQGLDVLGGSAMSGHSLWAVVGPVVAVIGLVLLATQLVAAARRRRSPAAGARAARRRDSRVP